MNNVEIVRSDVTSIPVVDGSMDKVLCLSVLQYLPDQEVRNALAEFARVLKRDGILVLHVKNISSLYLSSLWLIKRVKLLLRQKTRLEHFRSYRWYVSALRSAGFEVLASNSFNLFMIEGMPKRLLQIVQKFELKHYKRLPLRFGFMRRHGADLKIRARISRLKRPVANEHLARELVSLFLD